MVNKNILLVLLAILLLSAVGQARRLHQEDAPAADTSAAPAADAPKADDKPADAPKADDKPADAPKADDKPADAPKADDKPADAPKADDKPADAPKISSVEFCQCEGAISVTGEQLKVNTTAFALEKGELKLPTINWTNFHAPPAPCKDGYYRKTADGTCEAADAILNQDLEAPNLISAEALSILRKRQQAFFRANPTFKPIFCDEKTPYLTKTLECQACTEPKSYWDLDKLECVGCADNEVYNPHERKCIAKVVEKTPLTNLDAEWFLLGAGEDLAKYKNAQEEERKKNPNTYICDIVTPYVIDGKCSTCPKDNPLFYLVDNKCVKCKPGSYYEKTNLSCVAADPRMNIPVGTNNLLVDALALSEEQNKFYLAHPDFRPIVCEGATPFYNGEACVPCTEPTPLFNVATLKCDACKAG
jgi:hypothetical protein